MGSRLDKNASELWKRIEKHEFQDEQGEEYNASKFGGIGDYLRRKRIKLQNRDADVRAQAAAAGDKPVIFRGVVAQVNGYTQPSLNVLHELIVSHGGGFVQYLDGKTGATHIIASNLTQKKAIDFRHYRVVKPAWVVESVNAGKLLPWENYRLLDEFAGQKVLTFGSGGLLSQLNVRHAGYKEPTGNPLLVPSMGKEMPSASSKNQPVEEKTTASVESTKDKRPSPPADDSHVMDGDMQKRKTSSIPKDIGDAVLLQSDAVMTDNYMRQDESAEDVPMIAETETDALEAVQEDDSNISAQETQAKVTAEPVESKSPAKSKLTAEQHNTILLQDPHIRKSSVLNPNFLNQYYGSSRLHHLSSWKAELKTRMQSLTAAKSASQRSLHKLPAGSRRYILHVDFDSFFVAVSLLARPDLADKPCVVAHGAGPGSEIASCNYPARAFGVSNGMWMKRANEKCKHLAVLPYDFPAYEAASQKFYEAILDAGGVVQSVSIDEALVDVSSLCAAAGSGDGIGRHEGSVDREQAKAEQIARDIRARVKRDTGCAVSVGIGHNILLAKLALRKAKPAGQHHVLPDEALDFIADLGVRELPGVAYSLGGKLEEIGVKLVRDARAVSKEKLTQALGPKTGDKIYNYARGIDRTPVGDGVVRKSVSAEVNWGVRFETQEQVDEFMASLCGELERRLVKEQVRGRQLTVKVMRRAADAPLDPPKHLGHGKCDTFNKSVALGVATCDKSIITKEVLSIMRAFGFSPGELRGLGVQLTKLEPARRDGIASVPGAAQETGAAPAAAAATAAAASSQPRLNFAPLAPTVRQGERGAMFQRPAFQLPSIEEQRGQDGGRAGSSQGQEGARLVVKPSAQFKVPTTSTQSKASTTGDGLAPEAGSKCREKETVTSSPRRALWAAAKADGPAEGASRALQQDMFRPSTTSRRLNVQGTQFVLPSQVDEQVLAELPADVRARLAKEVGGISDASQEGDEQLAHRGSDAGGLAPRREMTWMSASAPAPSWPHRVRTIATAKRPSGRPSSRSGSGRGGAELDKVAPRQRAPAAADSFRSREQAAVVAAEVPDDFLASLPPDIRDEIVLEQQRSRQLLVAPTNTRALQQQPRKRGRPRKYAFGNPSSAGGRLHQQQTALWPGDAVADLAAAHRRDGDLGPAQGRQHEAGARDSDSRSEPDREEDEPAADGADGEDGDSDDEDEDEDEIRILELPAPRPRPTFTVRRLCEPGQLREAVTAWHAEFRTDGPHDEDVQALARYLACVVRDEGDLDKATGVTRWFEYVLDGADNNTAGGGGGASGEQGDTPKGANSSSSSSSQATAAWRGALSAAQASVEQARRQRLR